MIILILITIISVAIAIYCVKNKIEIETDIKQENEKIKQENNHLVEEREQLKKDLTSSKMEIAESNSKIREKHNELSSLSESINEAIKNQTEMSDKAYQAYWDLLDKKYKETDLEFNINIERLEKAYEDLQLRYIEESNILKEKLDAEVGECKADLDKIKSTRAAAIEAARREKEIEGNLSFYCVQLSQEDKADIEKLENIKPSLNKPRVLSMLIWQTWFRDNLKTLSNNILGTKDITGIYKITNTLSKECYIGQARNVKDRWVEHCKAGLGIDTPAANQLYQAMQEYGLWNFSFELLEEVPIDQLNEKEKYYISLYDSYNSGYNKNQGNSK